MNPTADDLDYIKRHLQRIIVGGKNINVRSFGDRIIVEKIKVPEKAAVVAYGKPYAASRNSYFIDTDGITWAWGDRGRRACGDGTNDASTPDARNPILVAGNHRFTDLGVAAASVVGLQSNGIPLQWGYRYTLIGASGVYNPSPSTIHGNHRDITSVYALDNTRWLINRDREAYGFGYNGKDNFDQPPLVPVIGDGTTTGDVVDFVFPDKTVEYVLTPSQVDTEVGLAKICVATNYQHNHSTPPQKLSPGSMLALGTDGKIYGWGANTFGEFGGGYSNTDPVYANNPLPMETLSPINVYSKQFVDVEKGDKYVQALDSGGRIWAWGYNADGRLGIGSINSTWFLYSDLTPTPVNTNARFAQLSCRYQHTLALTSRGYLYGWGVNDKGQLGDGTTTDSISPKLITEDIKFAVVSAGYKHSLGISLDGILYAWGWGSSGQLGNGTSTDRLTPTPVVFL